MTDEADKHSDEGKNQRHQFSLGAGGETWVPAPCCTWAKFGVFAIVTIAIQANPPTSGSLQTFRLSRDTPDNQLSPSEVVDSAFGVIAANFTAGALFRAERQWESGAGGILVRNTTDVRFASMVVTWRPITVHTR